MGEDPSYDVDFREHPEEYEIGRGEQGVFKVQPYKDELLPLWGIKSLSEAREAAEAIYERYREYRADGDFVGMDMARKYLQMGWTRSLRYAKYPGGRKRDEGEERKPQRWYDGKKREVSLVYKEYLDRVREDDEYQRRNGSGS
ncbi:DUF4385 family protein [Halostella sp. JP-L12]|uniref:DUF4385 family protein n=1 Tax=Halostella TaxID=1843185 RepID=UPI000EF81FCC|nr:MULTISPECIES: DUF4385 family protein [Halostella]NHN48588.1 DUF4385 family protein [Halostella sp. JP-L12]